MGVCMSISYASALKQRPQKGMTQTRDKDKSKANLNETEALQERRLKAKVLILGAESAGKSTLFKQMRILCGIPFTIGELDHYRRLVFRNIIHGLHSVLDHMTDLRFELSERNQHLVWLLDDIPDLQPGEPFPEECRHVFERLWGDPSVQAAYSRGNEAALPENLPYFFSHITRLFEPSYVPSTQDILHTYEKKKGLTEEVLKTKDMDLHMILVGDTVGEKRKWIHCFEDVDAVVFVASLNSYDRSSSEDRSVNQMEEAMVLWRSISQSQWFKRAALILCLNKFDLFEQRIRQSNINDFFLKYAGSANNADGGAQYFRNSFAMLSASGETPKDRSVYIHLASATEDKELDRFLLGAVRDAILKRNLNKSALQKTRVPSA